LIERRKKQVADASYDAVVIGGGHHGTIIACYLQNAGMQTAIFERQHELGGGACTEEYVLPGFLAQPCAHRTRFYGHPAFEDFNLGELGCDYIYPETAGGYIYDNETCYVGYPSFVVADPMTGRLEYSEHSAQKNMREVARFSERDAETMAEILRRYRNKWRAAEADVIWNPPKPWGEKDAVERLLDDPVDGMEPVWPYMPIYAIARDLFESDEMQVLYMHTAMSSVACHPDHVPSLVDILHLCGTCFNFAPGAVIRAGTHSITHALQRAFSAMGGKFFVHHEVDKIIIEHGVAKGIRLVDGTEIEAKKLVAADVDIDQLAFRLLGGQYFSPKMLRRIRNIDYDVANLFWGNIAVHELPDYKAASFNPDCNMLYTCNWGTRDAEYLALHHTYELRTKAIPTHLHLLTIPDTIWDKTRAPEGKHCLLVEQHTAPARRFSEREWLKMKRDAANEVVKQWQQYAPNMTWDNVIGFVLQTPYEIPFRNINMREGCWNLIGGMAYQRGRFRPIPELSGYRMPVKNVYLCSACTHQGGGIGRACSYNCFKVIAEDFGLPKIWEQKGRLY